MRRCSLRASILSQSEIAAAFAEREKIPVILLSPTSDGARRRPQPSSSGSSTDSAVAVLVEAMVSRGARSVAPVGGSVPTALAGRFTSIDVASCNAPASQAGESRFPIAEWRAARVDHLLLLGDAACASDAMDDVLAAHFTGIEPPSGSRARMWSAIRGACRRWS